MPCPTILLAVTVRVMSRSPDMRSVGGIIETARLFGFDRTGSDLKEAIDQQCETLIKMGRLHLDGDVLRKVG
jgi:hypothetical protein